MKNLLLLAITLVSMQTFAQSQTTPEPYYEYVCRDYTLYKCDSKGKPITNIYNPNYKQYIVEICQTAYPGHYVSLLQEVTAKICTGEIAFYSNPKVKIKQITYSPLLTSAQPE